MKRCALILFGLAACDGSSATTVDAAPIDAVPIDAPVDGCFVPTALSSARHVKRITGATTAAQGFWEYLPADYECGGQRPLLVFLHGVGENGDGSSAELDRNLSNGPPRLIARDQWPNDRPFIVLSPQHPGGGCPSAAEVHAFITFALGAYRVDPTRVYLTGLSCGAIGSWSYLGTYLDEQIAALVAIAGDGVGAWNSKHCELGKVPIWAFHGDADPTVAFNGSKVPMEGLAGCPSPPRKDARFTIYPGVGHDSWSRTYDLSAGHDIYTWMLAQQH